MKINGMLGDNWGAETSPSGFDLVYAQTSDEIAPGIVDFAKQIQIMGESLIDAISRARTQLAMSDTQRQLLDLQLTRAQQGLPPLDMSAYLGGGTGQAFDQRTIMLVLLGIAALILLTRKG